MSTTILFDFDYTLADSSDGIVACINHALGELGDGGGVGHVRKATGRTRGGPWPFGHHR